MSKKDSGSPPSAKENDSVKPALTSEEWGIDTPGVERDGLLMFVPQDSSLVVVGLVGEAGIGIGGDDLHCLAALALHNQPYGFTHEDVVGLRSTVEAMESGDWGIVEYLRAPINTLNSLADRIAALLPPRQEHDT